MKITIQKREPDKNGHRALRLVYYHGSKTGQNGSRAQKRWQGGYWIESPSFPSDLENSCTGIPTTTYPD